MNYLHATWCPQKAFGMHSDAAKRICDTYNLHRLAMGYGAIGKYFAAALSDGRSDNVAYDSKRDAVRHQHHNEDFYTFICIRPTTMNQCEAEVMLKVARMAYDKGLRFADPDDANGGREVIKRVSVEDQLNLANGRSGNLIIPGRSN